MKYAITTIGYVESGFFISTKERVMILLAESVLGELGKFDKVTVRSSTDVVKIAKLVEAIVI